MTGFSKHLSTLRARLLTREASGHKDLWESISQEAALRDSSLLSFFRLRPLSLSHLPLSFPRNDRKREIESGPALRR